MPSKVLLLTGCASGIGLHLTGALLRHGHRVFATDIDDGALLSRSREEGWDPSRVLVHKLDVRSAELWEEALQRAEASFGQVDILMNIAGFLRPGYVHELRPEDVSQHLMINVAGTVLGTHAAASRMIKRGAGHIINFGSLAALAPVPGLSLYSASKFAVRGFSLAAASELRRHGVYVTVIHPDAVQTPMLDLQVDYKEAALTFSGPRILTVEDIARLVIDKVLPDRPMEITIPFSRAFAARIVNSVPQAAALLAPLLTKKGRQKQARIKSRQGRSA